METKGKGASGPASVVVDDDELRYVASIHKIVERVHRRSNAKWYRNGLSHSIHINIS